MFLTWFIRLFFNRDTCFDDYVDKLKHFLPRTIPRYQCSAGGSDGNLVDGLPSASYVFLERTNPKQLFSAVVLCNCSLQLFSARMFVVWFVCPCVNRERHASMIKLCKMKYFIHGAQDNLATQQRHPGDIHMPWDGKFVKSLNPNWLIWRFNKQKHIGHEKRFFENASICIVFEGESSDFFASFFGVSDP